VALLTVIYVVAGQWLDFLRCASQYCTICNKSQTLFLQHLIFLLAMLKSIAVLCNRDISGIGK